MFVQNIHSKHIDISTNARNKYLFTNQERSTVTIAYLPYARA